MRPVKTTPFIIDALLMDARTLLQSFYILSHILKRLHPRTVIAGVCIYYSHRLYSTTTCNYVLFALFQESVINTLLLFKCYVPDSMFVFHELSPLHRESLYSPQIPYPMALLSYCLNSEELFSNFSNFDLIMKVT